MTNSTINFKAIRENVISQYTGEWNSKTVKHLLRRTIYGPSRSLITECVSKGLDGVVNDLLMQKPMPDPPLNYNFNNDPHVEVGVTWVDKKLEEDPHRNYRRRSLRAWTVGQALNQGLSVREKMYMFWHNHFAISDIADPRYEYDYANLIRENSLGNFKELVKKMTIEPAMLRYLNGNQNTKFNPNENYARELLELFTIGKGPQVAPGDYTFYTENDVVEIAKVLTGWRDFGYNSNRDEFMANSTYISNRHDASTKKLSERFDNVEITNKGEEEYSFLIDLIFEKEEVSKFITRKIYRWFVYHQIDETVENGIILPLAELLRESNYEVLPVIETLLKSDHFYQETFFGAMIKSPLDYTISMINEFEKKPREDNLNSTFNLWYTVIRISELLQQSPFALPDVAGWRAYYQEPQFYQGWINSTTMQYLQIWRNIMFDGNVTVSGEERNFLNSKVDILEFVNGLEAPEDPIALIDDLVEFLFPQEINEDQKKALKEVLLPGLPDYEWTVEFNDYVANPDDEDFKAPIENKLKNLLQAITAMPEYYVA